MFLAVPDTGPHSHAEVQHGLGELLHQLYGVVPWAWHKQDSIGAIRYISFGACVVVIISLGCFLLPLDNIAHTLHTLYCTVVVGLLRWRSRPGEMPMLTGRLV